MNDTPHNPEEETPKDEPGGWERVEREPEPAPAVRKLTRSSTDKLIGGVSGGLGRYFGVDPILFRIAFVVLTFAGGAGILAYIGLLAFVPGDDGSSALGKGNGANVAGVILLVLLALIVFGPPAFFVGPVLIPIAIVLGLGVLLWRAAGGTMPVGSDPARIAARGAIAFLIGLAAIGAFVGVFLLAAIGGGTVLAILAIVAGMALVVTAFAGGARWLILPALVLVLPLAIVVAGDIDIKGGAGERNYRPTTVAEVQPDYRLGMGELVVDLRDVQLPAGETRTHVEVGVGHAVVRVPQDACVTSGVEVGIGQASVLDRGSGGVDIAFANAAAPASDAPRLHLDGDVGIGFFEVVRGDEPLHEHGYRGNSVACPA